MLIILCKITAFNQFMFRGPGLSSSITPSPGLCLSLLHYQVVLCHSCLQPTHLQINHTSHSFQEEDLSGFNINCLQFSEKTLTVSAYSNVYLLLLRFQPHCWAFPSSFAFSSPASSCTTFHQSWEIIPGKIYATCQLNYQSLLTFSKWFCLYHLLVFKRSSWISTH